MLTAAIFVPLGGAIVFALLPGDRDSPTARDASLRAGASAVAAIPLVLLVAAWFRFDGSGGFELVESSRWIPTLGVGYKVGVDGISLPLVAMTGLLFVASIAYPVDYRGRASSYLSLMLFLEFASLGVFLALDMFLFYVFWDLSLVGMFFLIGAWGHGDAQRSALKFFLYTLAGSLALLLGIIGVYLRTDPRTFDIPAIIEQGVLPAAGIYPTLVFIAMFLGFAIKTPTFPFHTWLPPAHVDAPAPASAILAGVLLKMGTYGFVRFLMQILPGTFERFAPAIGVLAVISILYGALVALAQTNIKRLIAYTSVNHMGYVLLGLAAAGWGVTGAGEAQAIAITGAVVEMVAHGLITGALFLISGSILARAGTYDIDAFGGLSARAPLLTATTVIAAFASLGLPGLAGFVAEFQVFTGTLSVAPWLAAVGLLGIVITAAVFLRMLQKLFLGAMPERWADWRDLAAVETSSLGALLALVIVIGVVPFWLLDVIDSAARTVIGG